MSEHKLTRTEIPMCPECGEEPWVVLASAVGTLCCDRCEGVWGPDEVHWGYYAPDVAGVVADLKHQLSQPLNNDGYLDVTIGFLTNILDRLEGKS